MWIKKSLTLVYVNMFCLMIVLNILEAKEKKIWKKIVRKNKYKYYNYKLTMGLRI